MTTPAICVISHGGRAGDRPGGVPRVRGALERYGVPEEVLTDNGKQFTARFGNGGEVLLDRICRDNGIAHRLTAPGSPTTRGRSSASIRRCAASCSTTRPFTSLLEAQAAIDAWVRDTTPVDRTSRWTIEPVTPAEASAGAGRPRELLPLRLPGAWPPSRAAATPTAQRDVEPAPTHWRSSWGPVEFDRVVPPSGNCGRWPAVLARPGAGRHDYYVLGRHRRHPPLDRRRAGQDPALAPQPADLAQLARGRHRGRSAAAAAADDGAAIEVDRAVSNSGLVGLGRPPGARRRDPPRPPGHRPHRPRR